MRLKKRRVRDLNVALNESTVLSLYIAPDGSEALAKLRLLALAQGSTTTRYPDVTVRLSPVKRVLAILKHGLWNDTTAPAQSISLEDLPSIVEGIRSDLYEWESVDFPPRLDRAGWQPHPSLHVSFSGCRVHTPSWCFKRTEALDFSRLAFGLIS
jgi:hypothetical protein